MLAAAIIATLLFFTLPCMLIAKVRGNYVVPVKNWPEQLK